MRALVLILALPATNAFVSWAHGGYGAGHGGVPNGRLRACGLGTPQGPLFQTEHGSTEQLHRQRGGGTRGALPPAMCALDRSLLQPAQVAGRLCVMIVAIALAVRMCCFEAA